MANGPNLSIGGADITSSSADLFNRLMALKKTLPKETLDALEFRSRKGYKPVNIEEQYIDVGSKEEFDRYKKALSSIPMDPSVRNKFISELGYRPVLRLKERTEEIQETPQKKLVPRKSYELSFTTMPDKTIKLGSESEFKEASQIRDIDAALADAYRKKYPQANVDTTDPYKTYTSIDPNAYSKMYLSEQDRNAIISEYAKNKGFDPAQTVNLYSQKRNLYYPRELVAGKGSFESQGGGAGSTVYGIRNYLTTMIPKATEVSDAVVENVKTVIPKETEVTYPFKFGYKSSGSEPQKDRLPTRMSKGGDGCFGDACELAGERYAKKTKYLFKKKLGGSIRRVDYIKLYN